MATCNSLDNVCKRHQLKTKEDLFLFIITANIFWIVFYKLMNKCVIKETAESH